MHINEDAINITDEIATWPIIDIIKLLTVLEKNGYKKPFFDGYDAAFYVLRIKDAKLNENYK